MGRATTAPQIRKRWTGGEIDADPFALPQRVTIPAPDPLPRLFGFIRYADIRNDVVKATDSSPILGPFDWTEPLSAYRGVALRVAHRRASGTMPVILVEMVHRTNEKHSVVLNASFDGADSAARWRSWARVLRLPLLLENRGGELQEAERRLGSLRIHAPQPHAGANPLSTRRPMTFGHTGRPRVWLQRLSTGTRPPAY